MAEYPILFNADMVLAILAGRKTQTRRVVKPQPDGGWDRDVTVQAGRWVSEGMVSDMHCPYGQPGDRLWVRETHYRWTGCGNPPDEFVRNRCYADNPDVRSMNEGACLVTVPSIHMPRWASRITLEVVAVRAERVCEITDWDAQMEGWPNCCNDCPRVWFRTAWDTINGPRGYGWDANPWVWVVEFRIVRVGREAKE